MVLYNVLCMAMRDPRASSIFGSFQYVDRVMYSTIVGVAIGYGRDTSVNHSFAVLACGPEWDDLDLTLNSPPPADSGDGKKALDRRGVKS